MAIAVQCTGCRSRLGVPDTAAGRKVKCPKCAKMIAVPAGDDFEVVEDDFEVVDEEFEVVDEKPKTSAAGAKKSPAVATAGLSGKRPKKAVVQDDEDDDRPRRKRPVVDDDDDEDDRPRKKKGKAKPKSSNNMPLLIGGGVLVLLLLAVGGYLIVKGGDKGKAGGGGSNAGSDWTKFDAPDGTFTAFFPTGTPVNKGFDALSQGEDPKQVEQAKAMMTSAGMKVDAWVRDESGRDYTVMILEMPAIFASQMKPEELTKPIPKNNKGGGMPGMPGMEGGEILNEETTSIGGQTAKQVLAKEKSGKYMFARMFFAGNKLVIVGARSSGEIKADDKDVLTYFNKFEWKGPTTPASSGGANPADKKPTRRGR